MSSNRGLRMNTNNIIVSQNGQLKYNNDDGVSEYTITNIQPSELSKESSQSSKISNLNIPVQFKGPRLSNIYYGTNKISKTGQINDVSNFYESNNDADIGLDTSFGSIQFDGIGRAGGSGGEEGKNKGFSRSKGSISFNSKNNSRKGRPSGEEDGGRSNKSIQFVEQNDGGVGGYAGEEIEGSGSGGFIGFDGKNERWASGSGGEERGNIEFSGTQGSIRFGSKGNGRAGGYSGEKSGGSRSEGFIGFGRKNEGGASRSGEEEKRNKGFSGSNGSIRFDGKNEGGIGGFGEKNIKISGGHRANRSSRSRNIGRRGNFKLSIGSIQLGKENGEISRSNSILAKITGKNYGSRRFGNGNKFVGDSGMSEVGGSKSFGEKMNKFSKTGGIYEDRILDDYNENNRSDGTGEVRFGEYSSLENSGN
ncbi:glycine-rich cell wall structural protein 1.8-like isoform X2 [Aphis craccivora]|uniref:Glycine-rich cell wall structural protein 1.8-like isoform X2 n=1 Tax=Aphis craccivora TaxID=307492 RepID=A0A6G0Z1U5_APHCR|nr:glycine-rich cell wall structural protein 1.8-like isoform X2 [Aphis craccivora]